MQCIMKFTKQQVKQIIKEEIGKYIFEQDPFPSITLDNPEAMKDKTGEEETSDGDDEEEEELDADDWEGAFSLLWMMTAKSMAKDFIKKGIQPSRKSPRMRELRSWLMRNPVPQDSNRYEEFIENEIGFRGRIEDETVRMAQKFYERGYDEEISMAALMDPDEFPTLSRDQAFMQRLARPKRRRTVDPTVQLTPGVEVPGV